LFPFRKLKLIIIVSDNQSYGCSVHRQFSTALSSSLLGLAYERLEVVVPQNDGNKLYEPLCTVIFSTVSPALY